MGNIRSSWEIAQEKVDSLGDLSSEERTRHKEEQYRSKVVALVHQYLDDKDIRPVRKELDKYTGKERDMVEYILLGEFISSIDLDRQESLDLILSGIGAFSGIEKTGHGINAIKQLYDECCKTREEEKQNIDDAGREMLRDMGISGSAIGTVNLYARDEWLDRLDNVTANFEKQLESLKEEIIKQELP
jgi:hypothetical protein